MGETRETDSTTASRLRAHALSVQEYEAAIVGQVPVTPAGGDRSPLFATGVSIWGPR